ncbi:MAG: hypothetical protein WCK92_07795 [Bacteroidota bacterium]
MKIQFCKWLFILCLLLIPSAKALSDNPGPPYPDGDPAGGGPGPVGAPIDGGLLILLAQGVAYGGWKFYKLKKKTAPETDAGSEAT